MSFTKIWAVFSRENNEVLSPSDGIKTLVPIHIPQDLCTLKNSFLSPFALSISDMPQKTVNLSY